MKYSNIYMCVYASSTAILFENLIGLHDRTVFLKDVNCLCLWMPFDKMTVVSFYFQCWYIYWFYQCGNV